jgi:uncharacterized protein (UPF0335 family)
MTPDQIKQRIKQIDLILKKNQLNIGERVIERLKEEKRQLKAQLKDV